MMQERVQQADNGYQHHAHQQGVDPSVVLMVGRGLARHDFASLGAARLGAARVDVAGRGLARCRLGRHGLPTLKKHFEVTATGGGKRNYSPDSRLTPAAYLLPLSARNATSPIMVTGRDRGKHKDNRNQDSTQPGSTKDWACLLLACLFLRPRRA